MDDERLHRVLSGALRIWGVSGTVASDAGYLVVSTASTQVRVRHRSQGGWLVLSEHGVDEHAGIPGLLRTLRAELAPHAPAGHLVIASQPGIEQCP